MTCVLFLFFFFSCSTARNLGNSCARVALCLKCRPGDLGSLLGSVMAITKQALNLCEVFVSLNDWEHLLDAQSHLCGTRVTD